MTSRLEWEQCSLRYTETVNKIPSNQIDCDWKQKRQPHYWRISCYQKMAWVLRGTTQIQAQTWHH